MDPLKPQWSLVQVNHKEMLLFKMELLYTGDYRITFLLLYQYGM